ncbi:acyl-CoA dehydrogenase family protein [Chelatococcus reniformis]|uniref:Acyl-CoA dehydrogenase n=1 Tax=Chelatococcus reniformis TaxID=1494448 RepID=A0A916XLK8_9HYPH|nr:acyl-CoA dehydrogenase family protein [Chelatococcus reniformis]GGC81458.1 acyl-CoA dehydrogenase [Chelatococcus reniformis]
MPDTDSFIVETAERMFADLADPQTIIHARSDDWKGTLWPRLQEVGLTLAWVPEAQGGAGVSLDEGFGILRAAGRAALSVPLAETLVAGWLLARAGIAAPAGAMSVAPSRPRDDLVVDSARRLSGTARKVPFGRDADHLAVLAAGPDGPLVCLVRASDVRIGHDVNLAGEPSDTIDFPGVTPVQAATTDVDRDGLLLMGAAVRAQQIAGALEAMLDLSVRYATERVAFEKQISKFQAVQHNLAKLGGEVAAAVAAAASAADTVREGGLTGEAALLEVAAAKIRGGEAAETGAAIAHQVHGAIGFTDEHVLHRFTLRALGWRDDFGNESYWSVRLGEFVARQGADELWPLLASR